MSAHKKKVMILVSSKDRTLEEVEADYERIRHLLDGSMGSTWAEVPTKTWQMYSEMWHRRKLRAFVNNVDRIPDTECIMFGRGWTDDPTCMELLRIAHIFGIETRFE